MITALLLLGCPKPEPPAVFPVAVPELLEPPPRVPYEPKADACPSEESFVPSRPAPWVDDLGYPTCRANLVPTAHVLDLVQDADDAEHWRAVARTCHDYRQTDRAWAEQVAASCRAELAATQIELHVQRTISPVAVAVGVVVGAAIGVAAVELTP